MDSIGIRIPKLKGSSNYDIWAIRMKAYLVERGFYKVLTTKDRKAEAYEQESRKANALIRLTLEDSPLI